MSSDISGTPEEALKRVIELHREEDGTCTCCFTTEGYSCYWPCPTIATIMGVQSGDDREDREQRAAMARHNFPGNPKAQAEWIERASS